MRPQNQSERQSAIFRFWAIYILVLILPMVAFFYIFKNSGGANTEDLNKLKRQILEFERLTTLTKTLDSLSNKILTIDNKLVSSGPAVEKATLKQEADRTAKNIKIVIDNMITSKKEARSKAVVTFIDNIVTFLHNYIGYHEAFMQKVDFQSSNDDKNSQLAQMQLENTKLNGEAGQLKAQVEGLKVQLANCK